jgi:hypothetical protein
MVPRKFRERGSPAFQRWLSETDTPMLECRVFMHHWPGFMHKRTSVAKQRSGSYVVSAYCLRGCQVKRTQYVESDGVLDSAQTRYDYTDAKGYQYSEDNWSMDAGKRGLIRLELMRRRAEGEAA